MNEDTTQRLPNSEDDRLAQILSAVRNLSSRVDGLSNRVEGLERKVEERLYDTRPIWEKVQADIAQLQEGQKSLTEGQASLSANQQRFEERLEALRDDMRTGFRNLKRQFGVLHETFIEVRAEYKDLDNRVYKLETERDGSL